jgi:hypothetical protein
MDVGEFPSRPFGLNLEKLEHAGKVNPRRQMPRAEFANSISNGTENRRKPLRSRAK